METGDSPQAGALTPARGLTRLEDLAAVPELRAVLLDHLRRGVRVQSVLRACLAALLVATELLQPPDTDRAPSTGLAAAYLAWALVVAVVGARSGELALRYMWTVLFGDLAVVSALTLLAGPRSSAWTADILVYAFFLLPVLAATQLRHRLCAAVCAPTAVLYFLVAVLSRADNGNEPWSSIALRTLVLVAVSVGAVLLSRLQRSRVLTVGRLAAQRSALIGQLIDLEQRERRELSEALHDGALQYVLAARLELDDLAPTADPAVLERLDESLTRTAALLRSTVYELHPAVLESNGLLPALREVANAAADRGGFELHWVVDDASAEVRTDQDPLLFGTARELLGNVAKHARAANVTISWSFEGGHARLGVADDGRGLVAGELADRLREGHIGLQSRRTRIEAVGGSLTIDATPGSGTAVRVEVPAAPLVVQG